MAAIHTKGRERMARKLNGTILKSDGTWRELIICKDCKHCGVKHFGYGALFYCRKWGKGCTTDPEGYCYMASPKEGDEA